MLSGLDTMATGPRGVIRASGSEVLRILRARLKPDWRDYVALVSERLDGNPFAILVSIILSQNTSDKNSIQAYREFRRAIGTRPEDVLNSSLEDIERAIRKAGLARQKARSIKELAKAITEWGGESVLLEKPPEEVRNMLLSIPGVGPKTADVFLSLVRRAEGIFAVDTHAARIARRWGLAREKAKYDEVSKALYEFFGPGVSEEAHRLLIALGREYCTARNPRCAECPLKSVCPSAPQL